MSFTQASGYLEEYNSLDWQYEGLFTRTRWCDEDNQGVLNNAVYLSLFEDARAEYFKHLNLFPASQQSPFTLLKCDVRFASPGKGLAEVVVDCKTVSLGKTSFVQKYRVTEADSGEVWCVGEAVLVCWDVKHKCKAVMPPRFRKAVASFENIMARTVTASGAASPADPTMANQPFPPNNSKLPTLGILSGISYVSGADYYSNINKRFGELVPKGRLFSPNPLMTMVSIDCDEYADKLVRKDWQGVIDHLLANVGRLQAAGAEVLVIASNTGHICAERCGQYFPGLPLLHIADCTAKAILSHQPEQLPQPHEEATGGGRSPQGSEPAAQITVGLLGTEPTMRERYLKDRLALHGIRTIVPDSDKDLDQVFQYIMHELGHNVFKESTRDFFKAQVAQLVERGAQGVVLGCTEIELLLRPQDFPIGVARFASAELHIEAAAKIAAGAEELASYLPPGLAGDAAVRGGQVNEGREEVVLELQGRQEEDGGSEEEEESDGLGGESDDDIRRAWKAAGGKPPQKQEGANEAAEEEGVCAVM